MAGKNEKSNIKGSISRFIIVGLILIVILAVAIWAIISLFTNSREKTRYAFLNSGSIDETLTTDFLLVRDENLIPAENDGIFLPLALEGERLGKGEVYALVVPESAASLVDEYYNIKLEILERSLALSQSNIQPNSRLTLSEKIIQEAMSDLRASVFAEDIRALTLARKNFDLALQERSILLKPESFNDSELNSLLKRESDLLNQLIGAAPAEGVFRTANPCWISYNIFESSLPVGEESILELSPRQMRDLLLDIDLYEEIKSRNSLVFRGEPLVRCINSMDYKLCALLPDYDLMAKEENFSISLKERSLLLEDVEVLRQETDNDTLIVLQTDAAFDVLLDQKVLRQADLIVENHSGIKIPLQSLYDYSDADSVGKLLKIKDGVSTEVIVFVLAHDDTHAIIEGRVGDKEAPQEHELYVLNPWTSEPGSLLE